MGYVKESSLPVKFEIKAKTDDDPQYPDYCKSEDANSRCNTHESSLYEAYSVNNCLLRFEDSFDVHNPCHSYSHRQVLDINNDGRADIIGLKSKSDVHIPYHNSLQKRFSSLWDEMLSKRSCF